MATFKKDWRRLREPVRKEIDQTIEWGRRLGIPINLVLDSGRKDVEYEDVHGRKLDREMLHLLRSF